MDWNSTKVDRQARQAGKRSKTPGPCSRALAIDYGEVAERFKAPALKADAGIGFLPWVRIPPSPLVLVVEL
jgi:hypothetical protein